MKVNKEKPALRQILKLKYVNDLKQSVGREEITAVSVCVLTVKASDVPNKSQQEENMA